MALPPDIPLVQLNFGPVIDFEGLPLKGTTAIQPSRPVIHLATGTPIVPRVIQKDWDVDGTVTFLLPATDAAGLNVSGVGFEYRVTHRTHDASAPTPEPKLIKLPAAAPVADLDLLLPATASNGIVVAQPAVTSVAGFTGVVTADQLGGVVGGGGGAPSGGAGGFLSGEYPDPGVNVGAFDEAMAARVTAENSDTALALRAAFDAWLDDAGGGGGGGSTVTLTDNNDGSVTLAVA